jgi:hypothetical protein
MASKNTERRNEQEQKKQDAFIQALRALEKEHGYQVEPIMHYSSKGMVPQVVIVPIKEGVE